MGSYSESLEKNLFPNVVMMLEELFLSIAELRSVFPCWLSARDLAHKIEAAHIPWHVASSTFTSRKSGSNPSNSLSSVLTGENSMLLKGLVWLDGSPLDNILKLKSTALIKPCYQKSAISSYSQVSGLIYLFAFLVFVGFFSPLRILSTTESFGRILKYCNILVDQRWKRGLQ